jgi:hypothetical protein
LSPVRWGEQQEDPIFFTQSAILYSLYYWVQIAVHRRFIPRPRDSSGILSFPSLAICTNAARSCLRVCDAYSKRVVRHHPQFLVNVFISLPCPLLTYQSIQTIMYNGATVLLLNLVRSTQLKLKFDPRKDILDIHSYIELLRLYEPSYVLRIYVSLTSHEPFHRYPLAARFV